MPLENEVRRQHIAHKCRMPLLARLDFILPLGHVFLDALLDDNGLAAFFFRLCRLFCAFHIDAAFRPLRERDVADAVIQDEFAVDVATVQNERRERLLGEAGASTTGPAKSSLSGCQTVVSTGQRTSIWPTLPNSIRP